MILGKKLLTFPPLEEGILIKRYKRFLVDIKLSNGELVTAHCANTGPMTGVLQEGGKVRLKYVSSPTRKLKWSWEQAEVVGANGESCWVGVNTSLPNKIVQLAIESGFLLKELGPIQEIKREVAYGSNKSSRIDLLLSPNETSLDPRTIFLEVKNTTWTNNSVALFPDTVTERGQKHLKELINVLPESRAVLVPCLSRRDVEEFAPGDSADPCYGKLFRRALESGDEVIPCCFRFSRDCVTWEGPRPLKADL